MRRLVVRAPNWLGDAVMALPALESVRRHFPDAHLTIAAKASLAPLFEERLACRPDAVLPLHAGGEAAQLRAGAFDAVLLLTNSFGSGWVARRSGIAERWGYRASGRRWLLTRAVPRPRRVHQSDYYRELVRRLFEPGASPGGGTIAHPLIDVRPESRARGARLLEAAGVPADALVVGFAPGAAYGEAKRWPPSRVADVVAHLAREGVTGVLVGAADDRDTGRAVQSSLPAGVNVVNLIGRTDLRALAGVLARCRAFVSNDSGAMHLAAAIGVPVTAIFGPTDERATAPLGPHDLIVRDVFCRPCMLRDCPIDHRCMRRIDAVSVAASVDRHLGR
ncbi:MAG TPA: lipopolysaccharide heptosyltransferase II [Vicinamibacterales bacterium]|nr:lipopolysaccharide heptosyltransferase II [Vicinamibacterales bacterium]